MKQATKDFPIDNGTVYEGQVLPDSHPAVVRFPENFTDVLDDVTDDDGALQSAAAPYGITTDGTGQTSVVVGPSAEPSTSESSAPTSTPAETSAPAGSTPAPQPEKTLYRHTGTGPVDADAWPTAPETTTDGQPLYTFVGDSQPGDANGASADWEVYTPPAPTS